MISLCPLTVLPCSPIEQIDAALAAGYDSIGLRLTPALATDIDVLADPNLMDAIADRLVESGLAVLDVEVVRITPTTDVAALEPLLAYSGRVGARSLAVTGLPRSDLPEPWSPEYETAMIDKLRDLCTAAARHNVRPSIEFMIYRTIDTLLTARRVYERVGHENLSICIDALHFHRAGGTLAELEELEPAILSCFQICDATAKPPASLPHEARFGRLLPGEGDIDLVGLLKALPADIPIGVEAPTGQAGSSSQAKARTAVEATGRVLAAAGRGWG